MQILVHVCAGLLKSKFPLTIHMTKMQLHNMLCATYAPDLEHCCNRQQCLQAASSVHGWCRDDPSSKIAVARFAAEAAALLSPERPGDFNQVRAGAATIELTLATAHLLLCHNVLSHMPHDVKIKREESRASWLQAVMELGAMVCTQAPKCAECPIRGHCGAYADVQQHIIGGGSAASAPPVTRFPSKVSISHALSV